MSLHVGAEVQNQEIYPGFVIQVRHHQKSKQGYQGLANKESKVFDIYRSSCIENTHKNFLTKIISLSRSINFAQCERRLDLAE